MVLKNVQIPGKHNKPILTDFHYTKNTTKKPLVIFCHGYKGFKDWGAWNLMATEFAKQQFFFVKFNFSHNGGTVAQPIDFPDLKAFGNNNFTIELDDLQTVIDYTLENSSFIDEIDKTNISVIGHSRGGGIATLKTNEDSRISNLISWAGVSNFEVRFPTGFKLWWWKMRGVAYIVNGRTHQKMPHYISFYHDFIKNKTRFNIQKAAESLTANHLLIHGTNDDVVTLQESKDIQLWNPKSELYIIENMNHSLGTAHPHTTKQIPEDLDKVIKKTIDFINAQR